MTNSASPSRFLSTLSLILITLVLPAWPQTRLFIARTPAGPFELQAEGVNGTTNQVQLVAHLSAGTNWIALTNIIFDSVDRVAIAALPVRPVVEQYYRAVTTGLPVTNPNPAALVWIPPGTFLMGSPATETDRNGNEGPQTLVRISRGFFMSLYETTQAEYAGVMATNPSLYASNPYAPVDSVTWQDVTNYCARLTTREKAVGRLPAGYSYRLPTEAEWEYAARAGTTNRFSFGDDPAYGEMGKFAWYAESFGLPLHAVGRKARTRWGLYDIHGNVYEWCLDWYGTYPGGSVNDPKGTPTARPGLRGGSAWSASKDCRAAVRLRAYAAGDSYANAGFRVLLAQPLP
jgi:formylglycine-generating enzyme required for sulfatase activity